MEEIIKIPIGDDIAAMSLEQRKKLLLAEDNKLRQHAVETCRGQGLLEFQKENVEKQLAAKYGMIEYKGVYVKCIILRHIPQIFRDAIDGVENATESATDEPVTEKE